MKKYLGSVSLINKEPISSAAQAHILNLKYVLDSVGDQKSQKIIIHVYTILRPSTLMLYRSSALLDVSSKEMWKHFKLHF